MNGIQEAITAITAAEWAQLLASGATLIIGIAAIFVAITQGKRLLGAVDDPGPKTREQIIDEAWAFEGEPEDYMRAHGMTEDEVDRALYPSVYADETEAEDAPEAQEYADEDLEDMADPLVYANADGLSDEERVQAAIDAGDFEFADTLCNDAGLDKMQFNWH